MSNDKATYILSLQRDDIDTNGKSRLDLNKIFAQQTQNALVELKQAIQDENISDTRILNTMDQLGMVVVESTPAAIKDIEKLDVVQSVMENKRVDLIRPVTPKKPGDFLGKK